MKCPHCSYRDGYQADTQEDIHGEKGAFYSLPVKMERTSEDYGPDEVRRLYACPSCGIALIDV